MGRVRKLGISSLNFGRIFSNSFVFGAAGEEMDFCFHLSCFTAHIDSLRFFYPLLLMASLWSLSLYLTAFVFLKGVLSQLNNDSNTAEPNQQPQYSSVHKWVQFTSFWGWEASSCVCSRFWWLWDRNFYISFHRWAFLVRAVRLVLQVISNLPPRKLVLLLILSTVAPLMVSCRSTLTLFFCNHYSFLSLPHIWGEVDSDSFCLYE